MIKKMRQKKKKFEENFGQNRLVFVDTVSACLVGVFFFISIYSHDEKAGEKKIESSPFNFNVSDDLLDLVI